MGKAADRFFTIGKTGTNIVGNPQLAADSFASKRALLCRASIDPDLLDQLATAASAVQFVSNPVEKLGHRWIEQPSRVGAAIELALNRPILHKWLQSVTACCAKGRIEGRLVETRPGGVDHLDWHDDQIPNAQFGVSLHLRQCHYEGGAFELRDVATKNRLFRHANATAGDLVIFEVSPRSQHRVMRLLSGQARQVFTGWFIAVPD